MAELLVLLTGGASRTHFRGDVVTVQPDGFAWDVGEVGPAAQRKFALIKVPGAPVGAFRQLLESVVRLPGRDMVLYRRTGLNLMLLGATATFEQVQAARVEKTEIPLLT